MLAFMNQFHHWTNHFVPKLLHSITQECTQANIDVHDVVPPLGDVTLILLIIQVFRVSSRMSHVP
uniref:Uncharacterized protein n=1 Tax=Arundo donax TaxID=35708 RepID=A0A0A8ZTG7_ARUDO